jgi:predicted permease
MPLWKDCVYATRRLLSKPGYLAIALLTLALGVGFNAAIFTFVNAFLIKPLPIAESDRVMTLNFVQKQRSIPQSSYPNYLAIRDRNQAFTEAAAMRIMPMALSVSSSNSRIWGYLVSGNYFSLLGIAPFKGRFLEPSDDTAQPSPVAVLGYSLYQRQFASDPNIIGRSVKINGERFTIVGVAPPGFIGTERFFGSEIWVPFSTIQTIEGRDWRTSRMNQNAWLIGRLKPGLSQTQAEASLNVLAAQIAREHPETNENTSIRLSPPGLVGDVLRKPILGMGAAILGVALLTLLVACTNLAGLVLAHAADRRKEMAIRMAIGAGKNLIVRMMLVESVLLGAAGGVLGLIAAVWLGDLIQAAIPAEFPVAKFSPDWRVFTFGMLIALGSAIFSGVLPALRAAAVDVAPALKNETATGFARGFHLRDLYVGIQVAVCMILLSGSVMMIRTLKQTLAMGFGFQPDHTVVLWMDMAMQGYKTDRGRAFQRELVEKAAQMPGTEAASVGNSIPLALDQSNTVVTVEGKPVPKMTEQVSASNYHISPGFFRALGTRMISGRDFDARDRDGAPRVVIVNQAFADKLLPGEDPLGKRIHFGSGGAGMQIVGIVETGKYQTVTEDAQPAVFQPMDQSYNSSTVLVIRSHLSEQEVLANARKLIAGIDPEIAIFNATPLSKLLDFPLAPMRVSTAALTAMGGLGALLCALGLYGLLAYSAVQRTREIGIRVALGARASNVLALLVSHTAILVAISGAAGIVVSIYATRLIAQFLYAKSDASIYTLVALLLVAIAIIATLVPAHRVLRIRPLEALRHE